MIRIAVVDDHPHVVIALKSLLNETADLRVVADSRQGSEVLSVVQQTRPHILLLDLMLEPEFDGLSTVKALRDAFPEVKVCVFSAYLQPYYVRDLVEAGVNGYILKDDDYVSQIETIIRDLMDGKLYLSHQAYEALAQATRQKGEIQGMTDRELEILRLAERGLANPQIANSLHLSAGTIRNHLSAIYQKLEVSNKQQALNAAKEHGLI